MPEYQCLCAEGMPERCPCNAPVLVSRPTLAERFRRGDRLKRPELSPPVVNLGDHLWTIWICSRCSIQEHLLPPGTRQQIKGLRDGHWPTVGMRNVWPDNCYCGGVVREITVMVKPGSWSCPTCGKDLGAPECADCRAADSSDSDDGCSHGRAQYDAATNALWCPACCEEVDGANP